MDSEYLHRRQISVLEEDAALIARLMDEDQENSDKEDQPRFLSRKKGPIYASVETGLDTMHDSETNEALLADFNSKNVVVVNTDKEIEAAITASLDKLSLEEQMALLIGSPRKNI